MSLNMKFGCSFVWKHPVAMEAAEVNGTIYNKFKQNRQNTGNNGKFLLCEVLMLNVLKYVLNFTYVFPVFQLSKSGRAVLSSLKPSDGSSVFGNTCS